MLSDEVHARTFVHMPASSSWPESDIPVIVAGTFSSLQDNMGPFDLIHASSEDEGFIVKMADDKRKAPTLFIDLIVFGTNAIELIPPNTHDASTIPMFTNPPEEMLIEMIKLLNKYDLQAWIWYPLMHGDYTRRGDVNKSLEENRKIFSLLPKLDAVFYPGRRSW